MDGTGIGKDLTEIAGLLIGVALIALLVGNAGGTSTLIGTGAGAFNQLLQTVTLQNGVTGGLGNLSSFSTGGYGFGGTVL